MPYHHTYTGPHGCLRQYAPSLHPSSSSHQSLGDQKHVCAGHHTDKQPTDLARVFAADGALFLAADRRHMPQPEKVGHEIGKLMGTNAYQQRMGSRHKQLMGFSSSLRNITNLLGRRRGEGIEVASEKALSAGTTPVRCRKNVQLETALIPLPHKRSARYQ